MPVSLSSLTEPICENIASGLGSRNFSEQVDAYTCDHVLTAPGSYSNMGSVESTGNEHSVGRA